MRTIIAGSRGFTEFAVLSRVLTMHVPWTISVVISGTAKGADQLGERWAKAMDLPLEQYPANWKDYGRGAGPKRNKLMAKKADALVAFWDKQSRGTANMIMNARKEGLKIIVYNFITGETN